MDHLVQFQLPVINAALEYVREPFSGEDSPRFGRIVMPTRTGKTRIAFETTSRHGGSAVFLGATNVVVDQAVRQFGKSANCLTIQSLLAMQKAGNVPPAVKNADLVFVDEGHKFMTELRQGILRELFKPEAARIALTATPDYNEERALVRYFPDLIHEMSIREGVEAGIMSPYQAEAFAVDVGETGVKVMAGEFDIAKLGMAMSHLHMLKAAALVRYSPEYRNIPALITCTSRAQALALTGYLGEHRPKDTTGPGIAISGFDKSFVRLAREAFDKREIDTLITVGMLIEGWDAPHCKLLIDLAPSISWVRAAQKFSRVMTRVADKSAHIVMLIPADLPRKPVMPRDVFGPGLTDLAEADPVKWESRNEPKRKKTLMLLSDAGIKVEEADIVFSKIGTEKVEAKPEDRIRIDPKEKKLVRNIVRISGFNVVAGEKAYADFVEARFPVNGLLLSGNQFLKALDLQPRFGGYRKFIQKYFRGRWVDYMMSWSNNYASVVTKVPLEKLRYDEDGCEKAALVTLSEAEERESCIRRYHEEFHNICSVKCSVLNRDDKEAFPEHEKLSHEEVLRASRWKQELSRLLDTISPMEARILRWRFGLDDEDELTFREMGDKYNLSGGRIGQLHEQALAKIRRQIKGDVEFLNKGPSGLTNEEKQKWLEEPFKYFTEEDLNTRFWRRRDYYNHKFEQGEPLPWYYQRGEYDQNHYFYYRDVYGTRRLVLRLAGRIHSVPLHKELLGAWIKDGWIFVQVMRLDDKKATYIHRMPRLV